MSTFTPRGPEEIRDAVRWALASREPLEVIGGGTKRDVGEPRQTAYALDLSADAGIIVYEPEELVLTVRPGTSMAELDEALGEAGQMLAFEPPRLGPLLGSGTEPTFGGTFGSNLAGPRRVSAGAVRDHMLGITAVSGRGEIFKAGGRVVKNVTGYDLARALAGSWGTLAVAAELTVKTLPRPETELTLVLAGHEARAAAAAMSRAMGSSGDVSAAAHLPAGIAAGPHDGRTAATLLRLEGFGPSVTARAEALEQLLGGGIRRMEAEASRDLWRAIRDVDPFVGTDGAVWRVSVAPTAGPAVAEAAPTGSRLFFDWAGGLLWIEAPAVGDAGAARLRTAVNDAGGHATLLRAPLAIRATVSTFHPPSNGLVKLGDRLRIGFDPEAILNPNRMRRQP